MGDRSIDRMNDRADDWDTEHWHGLVKHAIDAGLPSQEAYAWADAQNPYRHKPPGAAREPEPALFPDADGKS
jgi:hypothetical protein